MTPLPTDPKVVILVNPNTGDIKIATNVSSDLIVEVTDSERSFAELERGLPFQDIKAS